MLIQCQAIEMVFPWCIPEYSREDRPGFVWAKFQRGGVGRCCYVTCKHHACKQERQTSMLDLQRSSLCAIVTRRMTLLRTRVDERSAVPRLGHHLGIFASMEEAEARSKKPRNVRSDLDSGRANIYV